MDTLAKVYVAGGCSNIVGLLIFNRCYSTAGALEAVAPSLFSAESQMLINLWGLAYIGTARNWKRLPILNFTFFLEKMAYVYWWVGLMREDTAFTTALEMITSGKDVLTGLFFLGFGANDLLFGLAFGYGAWRSLQQADTGRQKVI